MRSARLACLMAAVCLPVFTHTAQALPGDRQQAIEIQSKEAFRDEAKGLTTYSGDVLIKQGTIEIAGDKVTVETQANKVVRIVCTGRPARYQQQPEPDATPVIARGNTIRYELETDVVLLLGGASLVQDEATLSGERIEYDLKQEVIRAQGGSESGKERIRMVIPPSQQPEAN